MAEANTLQTRIKELLDATTAELGAAVGSDSLCAISKSGERVDGAKYLEGRMAALLDAQRRDDLAAVRATWTDALTAAQERDMGPAWVAYRTGGVDVLDQLSGRSST